MFTNIDHSLGHKTSFNEFKMIKIIHSLLSDQSRIRYQSLKKYMENTQISRTYITHISITHSLKKQLKRKLDITIELNDNENILCQNMWKEVK